MDRQRGILKATGVLLALLALHTPLGRALGQRQVPPLTAETIEKLLLPTAENQIKTMGVGVRGRDDRTASPPLAVDMQIPFDFGKPEISSRADGVLQELGKALSGDRLRGYMYEIHGHTCSLGNPHANMILSEQRAAAVKRYLVSHFSLSSDQLIVHGHGQEHPIASNDTEEGRETNRRVTVINTLRPYGQASQRPSLSVEAHFRRGQTEAQMSPGIALTDDDDYAVSFEPAQSCFVYVFQCDAQGKWYQLFPSSPESSHYTSQSNPVRAATVYRIPEKGNLWLYLDEQKGTEALVVIAYPEEVQEPLQVCQSILSGDNPRHYAEGADFSKPVKSMGVKGSREIHRPSGSKTKPEPELSRRPSEVDEAMLFRWSISFQHQ